MKPISLINTAVLLLVLGVAAPAYARQQDDAKPPKQEEKAKPEKQDEKAKPEKQQEEAKSLKQDEKAKPGTQEEAKPAKSERPEQAKAQQPQQHAQRSAAEEQTQRSQPALRLTVRSSGRIPDARFHSNFGRDHSFRIGSPRMVDGYSRFQYGGYWFGFVEPWPVGWYYTDDVYVDYIDGGYYLYNPSYPAARISISVVL